MCLVAQYVRLFPTPWTDYSHQASPGKNTGVGYHVLLQEVFPNQGSNPGFPHCWQILYHLSHQGNLRGDLTQVRRSGKASLRRLQLHWSVNDEEELKLHSMQRAYDGQRPCGSSGPGNHGGVEVGWWGLQRELGYSWWRQDGVQEGVKPTQVLDHFRDAFVLIVWENCQGFISSGR